MPQIGYSQNVGIRPVLYLLSTVSPKHGFQCFEATGKMTSISLFIPPLVVGTGKTYLYGVLPMEMR